jgi:hypothetical protein
MARPSQAPVRPDPVRDAQARSAVCAPPAERITFWMRAACLLPPSPGPEQLLRMPPEPVRWLAWQAAVGRAATRSRWT